MLIVHDIIIMCHRRTILLKRRRWIRLSVAVRVIIKMREAQLMSIRKCRVIGNQFCMTIINFIFLIALYVYDSSGWNMIDLWLFNEAQHMTIPSRNLLPRQRWWAQRHDLLSLRRRGWVFAIIIPMKTAVVEVAMIIWIEIAIDIHFPDFNITSNNSTWRHHSKSNCEIILDAR